MQPEAPLDVLAHPVGADHEALHEARHLRQHVVEEDRRIGQEDALGRRVADVPLVPEGLVLEGRAGVAAEQAGQAGDPLGDDRVALVGHRRAALLAAPERLHQLADLGVLEVADLGREALQRAAGDRDRGEDRGVAIALDDLGAHRVHREAEVGEDLRLEVGGEVAVRPDGPRDLAGRRVLEGAGQAKPVAIELEGPAGQLVAERRRLGMDGVGPAHHHRAGLGAGAGDHRGQEPVDAPQEQVARGPELEGQPGVDDVAAREAEVEVAALGADRLGDLADEGDDVVVGRPLDLGDPGHVDPGALGDDGEGVGRDHAAGDLGPRHRQLDPEHRREAGLVGPGRAHLRARVAADHRVAPAAAGTGAPAAMSRRRRRPAKGTASAARSAAARAAARSRAAADDRQDAAAVGLPAPVRRGRVPAWKTRAPVAAAASSPLMASPAEGAAG